MTDHDTHMSGLSDDLHGRTDENARHYATVTTYATPTQVKSLCGITPNVILKTGDAR